MVQFFSPILGRAFLLSFFYAPGRAAAIGPQAHSAHLAQTSAHMQNLHVREWIPTLYASPFYTNSCHSHTVGSAYFCQHDRFVTVMLEFDKTVRDIRTKRVRLAEVVQRESVGRVVEFAVAVDGVRYDCKKGNEN